LKQRIQTLDGLRCLAAMGVLWIHVWTAHKNPRFIIGKIDIASFLAIGLNGVELFFVISGFCMYYFYASKSNFSYGDFGRFLIKRWVRLSPAFYVATILYILVGRIIYHYPINSMGNFLHSIFYLDFLFSQFDTASHFWTLTVEWQFYFIIPLLLIYQRMIGFKKIFLLTFGNIFLAAVILILIFKNTSDDLAGTLVFRGIEFGFGVLAARLLLKTNSFFKNRALWTAAFIVITYSGRLLISDPVLKLSFYYSNLFKLSGFALMGCGFAGILYLAVTSAKWLQFVLGNKLFKSMGRVSYSFYLLHALIYPGVVAFTIAHLPFFKGFSAPFISTVISTVILYPISLLSFRLLEKPFLYIGNLTTK
jgi:peptidoglycan/LPS O-acetylase OafA/YrhL